MTTKEQSIIEIHPSYSGSAPLPAELPAADFGRRVGLNEESVWAMANNGYLKGAETRDGIVFVPTTEILKFKNTR